MDKPDLLMKAKALAALEHGVIPNGGSTGMAFHAVRFVNRGEHLLPCERPLTEAYDTPIEALAAAADALGLSPDPAVVVLTEDEREILLIALSDYRASMQEYIDKPHTLPATRAALKRDMEHVNALYQRLAK